MKMDQFELFLDRLEEQALSLLRRPVPPRGSQALAELLAIIERTRSALRAIDNRN